MKIEDTKQFPKLSKVLIKTLDEVFPSKDFPATDDVAKLNFHYGQRSVIQYLQHQYKIQNENILNQ
tara:strand:+ start:695 stop:892 length:198 start_codon:yes stop_codon:yes gene_type:complete